MGRKAAAALRSGAGGEQGGTNQDFVLESSIWLNPRHPRVPALAGRAQLELGCVRQAQVVSLRRPSPRQLESLGPGQQVTQHRLTCAREPRLFLVRAVFKAAEFKWFQIAPQRMCCEAGAWSTACCMAAVCPADRSELHGTVTFPFSSLERD